KLGGEHFNALLRPVPFGMQRNVTVQSINGKEVRIERSEDGTITVTKTERNGEDAETSTATYADEDAFAAADPDTYESYKNNFPSTFKFDNGYSMMFAPHLDGRQLRLKLNGGDVDFD